MNKLRSKAFTLVELLVVISIVGVLSSVTTASLNSAREKARDAQRLLDMKEIQKALLLYYEDNGHYPDISSRSIWYDRIWVDNWVELESALSPYIDLPSDPINNGVYYYVYESHNTEFNGGDDNQTYGLAIKLESPSNSNLEQNDNGSYSYFYEVGELPKYCKEVENAGWMTSGEAMCESRFIYI